MTRAVVAAIACLLISTSAAADVSFQFAMPGVQAPAGEDVRGMRLVFLYGKNREVRGFDAGLAAFSESVNQSGGSFNMGVSHVTGSSSGCGCSLVNIHEGEDRGANVAFINIIKSAARAVNVSFLNLTEGTSSVDVGGFSMSKKTRTQVGFINMTEEIGDVQIGFLNIAQNGFFPVFPFFNYPKK